MKYETTSQNTKKMLAETLKSLLQKKSLSKITVSEIVNACQINRKTFYYHFTDIYDLLEWYLNQEILGIVGKFHLLDEFDTILNFSLDYLEQNTYLLNCASDPIGYDKLVQFLYKELVPITFDVISQFEKQHNKSLKEDYKNFLADIYAKASALFIVDTLKNKNNINKEQLSLYLQDTFRSALEGIFYKL